jgi:hypothetical protein
MPTIDIPGGSAVLYDDASELTPRRRRPVELLQTRIGRKLTLIQTATRLICDGEVIEERDVSETRGGKVIFDGGDVELTGRDLDLLSQMNDALAWALLKSWTLDRELPATPDDMLDLDQGVYNAVRIAAAEVYASNAAGEFTPAAMEDLASPTGA